MSNYPPPPTFGTPFNPNVHMEPPVGSYDHRLPQYPYPYQNASSLYGQGQTNGTPRIPHMNANTHSFRSNAQDSTISSSGNEGNGAPYAPYNGQSQYGAFRPPAFPPTPLAHGIPSHETRPFSQPSINSNLPSNSSTVFSSVPFAPEVSSTDVGVSDTVAPALSELEDGELDDGEVDEPTVYSRASTSTSSRLSQQKRHDNEESTDKVFSHHVANTPNEPLPGLIQGSLPTPNPQGFTTSKHQQHSMRNGFVGSSNEPMPSLTAETTSTQHQLSANAAPRGLKEANLQSADQSDQKIEEAKQALRDLRSQGFDFNQLVNKGLNPVVLQKLYSSIGQPVTATSNLLRPKTLEPRVIATAAPTESPLVAATAGVHDQQLISSRRDLNGDIFRRDTTPNLATHEDRINSQTTVAAAKNEGKSVSSQGSLAISSKPSNLNLLGKASGSKAGETKILDRKDYIARMLAAKAGKPAASAATIVSPKTSTITDLGASAQIRSPDATAATNLAPAHEAASESVDIGPGTQREDTDAEVKRRAQTDLARQKIEALKLRESVQQQARSATSSDAMKDGQQPPPKSVSNIPAENHIPSLRHVPNRQSSYFSPSSQKPPFNIPGLFMTSDAPKPVNPPQPVANEATAVLPQRVSYATLDLSQQGPRPQTAVSTQSPPVNTTSRLPETSSDLNHASPAIATITTTTSSNRKRQKASDFIDSPSTRVKRPLGQQEDISVIIDISDDEVSDTTSGDEVLDVESTGRRASLSKVTTPGDGREKTVKGLPQLTDFPPRKKAVVVTPPVTQAFGQGSDLKGLKSKEMEIEVLNRQIAELQQRIAIKAKQAKSGTHSPEASSRVTISPPPGEASHQIHGEPNLPSNVSDSRDGDVAPVEDREASVAVAEGNRSAAAEQLNAERQLEEVELAKAEAERCLAAEISQPSAADKSLKGEEKTQIPQAEEQSHLQEGLPRFKDEQQKQVQDEEQCSLEASQSQQGREAQTKKIRQLEVDRHFQEQEERHVQEARQERLREQEREKSLDDQRQARKSEIESGLPILDAEVERTRKRLESLRQEMAGLEKELQKGIEGRQSLIDELHNLSRSREALPGPMDLDPRDEGDVAQQSTNIQELPAVTKLSTSVEMGPNSDQIQLSGAVGNGRVVQEKPSSAQTTDDCMSDGEVEEDVMDISRSDVDEAEHSVYSPKPLTEVQDATGFIDNDENYEPPNEINITQGQELGPDHVLLYPDHETAKTDLPAVSQSQISANQYAEPREKPASGEPSSAINANMADDEQSQRSLSCSPSLADASDPDDYEPPEPAPSGEEAPRRAQMPRAVSEKSFSPPDVDTNGFVEPASSDLTPAVHQKINVDTTTVGAKSHSVQKLEPSHKMGHFTPYESPLKQFKSFRYHPQYLKEVSNGFRSLTYSHTINPEIPLCRYELDGVCNDDSCQSQHLRDIGLSGALIEAWLRVFLRCLSTMFFNLLSLFIYQSLTVRWLTQGVSLSDDKILVDLGAKPDHGSSEEFGNGLREIIHDIRSKKIRDFNIVAGKITTYRAKFRGDSSKVLPL